ncbi:hypothetical protein QC763_117943 [Podospora pseudopauciseta]|uniref:Pectate lyase n=1 Tax=Podospora pseudopauciseta TaxID=2093780 RepID=A0ABR0I1E1_9PEZI|nr:hypothetical protein QC763_117943 [Podospora pseudopauciseta]
MFTITIIMHAAFNNVFDIDGATVVNNGARIDYTPSSSESVEPKSAINNGDLNFANSAPTFDNGSRSKCAVRGASITKLDNVAIAKYTTKLNKSSTGTTTKQGNTTDVAVPSAADSCKHWSKSRTNFRTSTNRCPTKTAKSTGHCQNWPRWSA